MATFEVTIETIEVHPHPNADRLEFAQVGLYHVVVPKGKYETGDEVFYIPEYAILPEPLIVEMGLEGRLSGKAQNRVKPIRLRGLLSQGLVAPLSILEGELDREKTDFSEALDITKWEPVVPASLAGDVTPAPALVRWIDIENIKKFPNMFKEGEHVVVDEKIHGTCTCITVIDPVTITPEVFVTSKGIGARNLALKESEKNSYWRMFRKYDLKGFSKYIGTKTNMPKKVAIFGETYGSVQDLHYGLNNDLGFILFDIHITHQDGTTEWLTPEQVAMLAHEYNIPMAPRLFSGAYSLETITALSYGKEQVSGRELNMREGVVVRPAADNNDIHFNGTRKIGKFVSDDYVTRKGGTEYN